jgi:hypothetical protein
MALERGPAGRWRGSPSKTEETMSTIEDSGTDVGDAAGRPNGGGGGLGALSGGSSLTGKPVRTGLVIGDRFTLLRRIGGGGMGDVFEAEDTRIRRRVALKLLHPHYVQDLEITRRFLR